MKVRKILSTFTAICLVLISLITLFPSGSVTGLSEGEIIKEIISSNSINVAEGLTYKEASFKTADGRSVSGFMLDSNYGTPGSKLKISTGMPYDETTFAMQPVSEQMRYAAFGGRNVLAGVNADFYNMSTGEPTGLFIKDGVEVHAWQLNGVEDVRLPYRTFFGILNDGKAVIGNKDDYELHKDNLLHAVSGDYIMVKNGAVTNFAENAEPDNPKGPYPRTCVGIRENGSVIFICVDGKRPNTYSAGLTLLEMAQLMVENGAVIAMNLDGGGSTTMAIKHPETNKYTLMNSPSDGTSGPTGGRERSVANCLYIYNDDAPSIPPITLDKDVDGYYFIRKIKDFEQINYNPSANFRLAGDIDGSGTPIQPVNSFRGILDGGNHTVNNLSFSDPEAPGLIGLLGSSGVVKDLTVANAVVNSTSSNVGILVGESTGTVRNVNVTGEVTGENCVAGLIGRVGGSQAVVENCHVVADVKARNEYAGILIGYINSNTVGEISRCSARGSVDGTRGIGGFIGYVVDSKALWIRDCMLSETKVHGSAEHVGGMFGMSKCGVERCFINDVTVRQDAPNASKKHGASLLTGWHNFGDLKIANNVVYKGSVTAANNANSHRVAEGSGTRNNNYASKKITVNGEDRSGGNEYYEGITKNEPELMVQSFYEGLGFSFGSDKAWTWDNTYNIPVLTNSSFNTPPAGVLLLKDDEGYFLIDSPDDFAEMRKALDAKYRLVNDLSVNEGDIKAVGSFAGEFDGQGHAINGYTSDRPLFAELKPGAVLKNLSIVNANVKSQASILSVAVGVCDGATISYVKVQGNLENTASGGDGTAGIVGQLKSTSGKYLVENCSANVNVSTAGANCVGSVFGQSVTAAKGEIRACYGEGSVSGSSYAGGFGGCIMDSANVWVRDCMTKTKVFGNIHVGGFIGMAKGGVERCVVVDADVRQEDSKQESKRAASFITGWHNYKQLKLANNVIYSGSITTTYLDKSFNIADGSGTRENNYVSDSLTINGNFRKIGDARFDGITATEGQLTSQAFYEGLGFNFSSTGAWDWNEKIPVLKGVEIQVPEKKLRTENEVLGVGADETQRLLTWYSNVSSALSVQYAPMASLAEGEMPASASVVNASSSPSSMSGKNVYRASLTKLSENTEYAYRMGSDQDGWTEIHTFKTGSFGDFSFFVAGDPQIGSSGSVENDKKTWKDTLGKARVKFPDSSFLLSLGDQVDHAASETEYSGFLSTGDFKSLALSVLIGNHDSGSGIFKEHFSVPNAVANEGDTAAGGNYWFLYNNMLVMCLNSNNRSTAQHKKFLEETMAAQADKADWHVVAFHHSIYSTASHAEDSDILERRQELSPVFSELGIDVVFMGHDHVYTRSYMMNGIDPIVPGGGVANSVNDPADGQVLYITANSSSGSKFYSFKNAEYPYAAVKNQENVPNISKVDVTENSFAITTYRTSDMSEVDSFTIYRKEKAKPVTSVKLDKNELTLEVGKSSELAVTVEPDDAGNKSVIWTSSDNEVVAVKNGVVTAKKVGTATITVTTADGGLSARCTVSVKAAESPSNTNEPGESDNEDVEDGENIMTQQPEAWTKGSKESAGFTSSADFADFLFVRLDGGTVNAIHYDVKEGSTIVTFKSAFLESLSVGKHLVEIVSKSGTARGLLVIKASAQTGDPTDSGDTTQQGSPAPTTGESSGYYLWPALILFAASGILFMSRKGRTSKRNR